MCIRDRQRAGQGFHPRSASEIHGADQDAGKGKAADQRGGERRTLSDKIRKYVLPNLPYLFVFWFFSKIGTAYRIAPGTDFGTKLMGMLDTFPKAFETYWPGLGGIDLLVGLVGAAGMYLLIQSKIKKAKKFRRDAEYGTALSLIHIWCWRSGR